jgi:hypothetical protein
VPVPRAVASASGELKQLSVSVVSCQWELGGSIFGRNFFYEAELSSNVPVPTAIAEECQCRLTFECENRNCDKEPSSPNSATPELPYQGTKAFLQVRNFPRCFVPH